MGWGGVKWRVPEDRAGWVCVVLGSWVVAAWPGSAVFFLSAWTIHGLLLLAASWSPLARWALARGLEWVSRRRGVHGWHLLWLLGARSLLSAILAHAGKDELWTLVYTARCRRGFQPCALDAYMAKRGWRRRVNWYVFRLSCPVCRLQAAKHNAAAELDRALRPIVAEWSSLGDQAATVLLHRFWEVNLFTVYSDLRYQGAQEVKQRRFQEDMKMLEEGWEQAEFPAFVARTLVLQLPTLLEPGWGDAHFHHFVLYIFRQLRHQYRWMDPSTLSNAMLCMTAWGMRMSSEQIDALLELLPSLLGRHPRLIHHLSGSTMDIIRWKLDTQPVLRKSFISALRKETRVPCPSLWTHMFPPVTGRNLDVWVSEGLGSLWSEDLEALGEGGRTRLGLEAHMREAVGFVGEGGWAGLRAFLYSASGALPRLRHLHESLPDLGGTERGHLRLFHAFVLSRASPPSALRRRLLLP